MEMRQPPRFVPTLTDVVSEPTPLPASAAKPIVDASPTQHMLAEAVPSAQPDWSGLAQQLQQQVLQQLELELQEKLAAEVAGLIATQMQQLSQTIRTDVERLVSRTVQDVLARELEALRGAALRR